MRLFNRQDVEVLSMHIPKTDGASFLAVLEGVYGRSQVVRFDMRDSHVYLNEHRYPGRQLPGKRVLHGRFTFGRLQDRFTIPGSALAITWVRDPVERVVSSYNDVVAQLRRSMKTGAKLNPSSRVLRSLIEFARDSRCRDRQSRYFRSRAVEDFAFVGILEDYESEVLEAGRVLGWKTVPRIPPAGTQRVKLEGVPPDWLDEIRELNAADIALYQRCLQLRDARLAGR